jgi:hypothetical protein
MSFYNVHKIFPRLSPFVSLSVFLIVMADLLPTAMETDEASNDAENQPSSGKAEPPSFTQPQDMELAPSPSSVMAANVSQTSSFTSATPSTSTSTSIIVILHDKTGFVNKLELSDF